MQVNHAIAYFRSATQLCSPPVALAQYNVAATNFNTRERVSNSVFSLFVSSSLRHHEFYVLRRNTDEQISTRSSLLLTSTPLALQFKTKTSSRSDYEFTTTALVVP